MQVNINIAAGTLGLRPARGAERLGELLGFASRQNPRRHFMFVSKVLGKHLPARPAVMRSSYDELAKLCGAGPLTYVVGMAETATALGAGVADSLAQLDGQGQVIYQHTTRHRLARDVWCTSNEAHSHAVDHLVYRPLEALRDRIHSATRLVLVDDELTTGRTLRVLARGLLVALPQVRELLVVSLVNWLDEEARAQFVPGFDRVRFVSLLDGTFEFAPDARFSPEFPANTDSGISIDPSREDLGRCGIVMPFARPPLPVGFAHHLAQRPTAVVGTLEHMFEPFLAAEQAEAQGADVTFQATTRSPILPGNAIASRLEFEDRGKRVGHFLYNLAEERDVAMFFENEASHANSGLLRLLGARQRVAHGFVSQPAA